MKRVLAVLVMAALMIFGVAAFATGPLLGVSAVPSTGFTAALSVGYDFGEANLEAWKLDLTTPFGPWAVGVLWTPQIGTFGYRAGTELVLDYVQAHVSGTGWVDYGVFEYSHFNFIIGVSNTRGPIQLYGEFVLSPFGALIATPMVGVNILFGDLIPDKVEL